MLTRHDEQAVAAARFAAVNLAQLRFNWVPAASTEGEHLAAVDRAVRRADALDAAVSAAAVEVVDRLTAMAPAAGDHERGALLRLRRDVYNGRKPKGTVPLPAAQDAVVAAWLARRDEQDELWRDLRSLLADATTAERALVQRACASPEFLRALSATSRELCDDARRYAAAGATPRKRLLKSEPAILRYLDRARLKTSPFSWYTSVALVQLGGAGLALAKLDQLGAVCARVELGHAAIRRVVDAVLRHPEVRPLLSYVLASRVEGGGDLVFEVTVDEGHPRVHRNADRRVSLGGNRAVLGLVQWMEAEGSAVTWSDLHRVVSSWNAAMPAEAVDRFLVNLAEIGVLQPAITLPEQATDLVERAEALLTSIPSPVAGRAAEALGAARGSLADVVAGDIGTRSRAFDAIEAAFADAFAAAGREGVRVAPVYENTVVTHTPELSAARWAQVVADARDVADVLEAFDRSHTLRALLREEFVAAYGDGGRCDDIFAFRDVVGRAMERWGLAIMGRDAVDGTDERLAAWASVRRELVGEYLAYGRTGREELVIDAARVDAIRAAVARSGPLPWSSYSLFLQPELGPDGTVARSVLNHFYNGLGAYMSRFLAAVGGTCAEATRARLQGVFPDDRVVAELRPVCGFNANLHPLLAEVELDVDGRSPGAWPLRRLRAQHDGGNSEVFLVDAETGRRVELLYLGFLVPFLLPSTWAALYTLASRGPVLDPFAAPAEASRTPEERGRVRSYPRVRLGSIVVERRRWYVPPAVLRAAVGDGDDAAFLVALHRWRTELGMPDAVFVRPRTELRADAGSVVDQIVRQAPWSREKPQYLHFSSPLRVAAFRRWLARATEDVVFEEALPVPAAAPIIGPSGGHVAELVLELDRPAPSAAPRG